MHSIDDFENGDEVYHLSDRTSRFIVIEIVKEKNNIVCNYWHENEKKTVIFFPYELGKVKDLNQFYVPTILE
jgi:hypothetical protein